MIELGLDEVARTTGAAPVTGRVTGDVVVDSRAVRPGDLFVALPGERVDGHDYAAAAAAAGAVAVLAGRELPGLDVPVLVVHPADDVTVPALRSREYVSAARCQGGDVELVEPRIGGHRAPIDPASDAWRAAASWLEARRR